MNRLPLALAPLLVLLTVSAAEDLARYGAGDGPRRADGVLHLLDAQGTPGQSNAVAARTAGFVNSAG